MEAEELDDLTGAGDQDWVDTAVELLFEDDVEGDGGGQPQRNRRPSARKRLLAVLNQAPRTVLSSFSIELPEDVPAPVW